MLNLVQIQERLRDVPMQALMQYANGSNPQIPPFLALGELNRRKKMQESAAADQAQEMEGSTVKQQIEQAAGLLALQGSRQRQASQQQQGIQAKAPMPAPNTTTSEPAQLAGGGFLDDIVVPRDYQAGGQAMNPDMLKKLMMLKAMKQRQGVAGLPMNAFKRSDYAGGGIVAFQTGGSTFDEFTPEGSGTGENTPQPGPSYARPDQLTATKEQIAMMSLAELQEYYRTGKIPDRLKGIGQKPKQEAPADIPTREPRKDFTKSAEEGGLGAVSRFLKIDPEKALPEIKRQKAEEFKAEREEQNKVFGVSADPYADLKRRYKEVEEEDKRVRGQQPMDRLMEMLAGITEGRGGNWATQGAAGAKKAMALEAQQNALNRKQALDMAALQSAIAEKEDARARGDRDAYIAADQKAKDANAALQKDRLNIRQSQAQIENQNIQAQNANRGGFPPERRAIMIQEAVRKKLDANPRVKILEMSNKPEDRAELEQIKKRALAEAIAEVQAIMNSMEGLGSLEGIPTGGQRIRYDAQGNPIQ